MIRRDPRLPSAAQFGSSLPNAAGRIVAELLDCQILDARSLREGMMTFKVQVTTQEGKRVIVRFYPRKRGDVINQEPDVLARCRAAGLPVPHVISDSRTGPKAELAYVAYYMIEGTTLASCLPSCSSSQVIELARNLAAELAKLDAITFEGAGEISTGQTARDRTWEAFAANSMRRGLESVRRHSLLDKASIKQLSRIVDRGIQGRAQGMHSLVWGDINFGNILVGSDHRIAGLIDFESCLSGDPLATLGYCFAAHGDNTFVAQLMQHWSDTGHERKAILIYALLRALRLARFAHLPLPTGYARDPLVVIFPGITQALRELSLAP